MMQPRLFSPWIVAGVVAAALLAVLATADRGRSSSDSRPTGRYQIAAWGGDHHAGYYVVDTVTGEVVAKKIDAFPRSRH